LLAELQGRQRGKGVRVFTRAHDDRIELLGVVVEFAEIDELASLWMSGRGSVEICFVYIV